MIKAYALLIAILSSGISLVHARESHDKNVKNPTFVGSMIIINTYPQRLKEAGAVDPAGRFFVLSDGSFKCDGLSFEGDKVLFDTKKALGVRWENGVAYTQFIFSKPGRYQIIVADNLETELDNSLSLSFYVDVSVVHNQQIRRGNNCLGGAKATSPP